jgi:hypothetical protein
MSVGNGDEDGEELVSLRMKRPCLTLAAILLSTINLRAQERSPIKGDYEWIAACVFQKFDADSPGAFRYVDLRAHRMVLVTMDVPIAGGFIRSLKATFSKSVDGFTSIEAEGPSPGYQVRKARELAQECSAAAPSTTAAVTKKPLRN